MNTPAETHRSTPRLRAVPVTARQRLGSWLLILAGIGLTIALATAHPSGWVPECPTHRFLGVYCPGCGSMRASHLLLQGQLADAFAHNPMLIVLGVPLAVLFWGEQIMIALAGRRIAFIPRSAWMAWAALFVLLLFALLRNLPGELGDRLSPPVQHEHAQIRSISTPPGIERRNDLPYPVLSTRGSRITT
ncbi:MAG: DUF2752 domain-containing protein [Phycisphaerales bacterium]